MRQAAGRLLLVVLLVLCGARAAPGQEAAANVVHLGLLGEAPGPLLAGLRDGLDRLGYVEGRNIKLETRFARGQPDQYPPLAKELVARHPDVLLAIGTPAAIALQHATRDRPIVMMLVGDPVGEGLVASLEHPGGNITGFVNANAELEPKRLELLKEIVPGLNRVATLRDPVNPGSGVDYLQTAAAAHGVSIAVVDLGADGQIDFAAVLAAKPQALFGLSNLALYNQYDRVLGFLAKNRLPSAVADPGFVTRGGLLSYATDYHHLGAAAADYVERIVKGAKPGELPVQQPTKFELVINLKTADALGLTVPPELLERADDVIE